MTTKPYSELLEQVEALAGATLATAERSRVKIFANRRARHAHRECPYWPRFLRVGEERIVSEDGLLPLEQTGLDTIDQIIRIHATDPFKQDAAFEYSEYYHDSTGIQITGYQLAESLNIQVSAETPLSPDATGDYLISDIETVDGRFRYYYAGNQDASTYPFGYIEWNSESEIWDFYYYTDEETSGRWTASGDVDDPVDAGQFIRVGSPEGPRPTLTHPYSAYVTYLAAPAETYGDDEGEEDEVPSEWFEYMAQGAYCDWLRSDGQTEKALAEEIIAEKLLNQQLEKVSRQNGNQVITRVVNHANMQWR